MKYLGFATALLFIALFGCTSRNENTQSFTEGQIDSLKLEQTQRVPSCKEVQTVDLNHCLDAPAFGLEQLIDTMYVIPLETNENSYLDQISKIIIGDAYIYIMDNYMSNSIAIFGKDGKFIRRLPQGKGHGELFHLYDMDYDSNKRQLIAYQHSFLIFYTEDGQFVESKRLPLVCHDIAVTDNGFLIKCLDGQGNKHLGKFMPFTLFAIDNEFAIKQAALPFKATKINYGLQHNMYNNSGTISIAHAFSDTIYEYRNNAIQAKYYIDYSDKHFNSNLLDRSWNEFETKTRNTDCFFFIGSYISTSTHSFVCVENWHRQNTCMAYYNKSTHETLGSCSWTYDGNTLPCMSLPIAAYGDFFVALHDHDGHEKQIKQSGLFSDETLNIITNMQEGDNPVLVLYKVKL
ncbi:MAG: 6-bladed beta-propeller [Paraprevotella sp.]|nr:6-bladed beta-propeller [Paraprevotella sp.]